MPGADDSRFLSDVPPGRQRSRRRCMSRRIRRSVARTGPCFTRRLDNLLASPPPSRRSSGTTTRGNFTGDRRHEQALLRFGMMRPLSSAIRAL